MMAQPLEAVPFFLGQQRVWDNDAISERALKDESWLPLPADARSDNGDELSWVVDWGLITLSVG